MEGKGVPVCTILDWTRDNRVYLNRTHGGRVDIENLCRVRIWFAHADNCISRSRSGIPKCPGYPRPPKARQRHSACSVRYDCRWVRWRIGVRSGARESWSRLDGVCTTFTTRCTQYILFANSDNINIHRLDPLAKMLYSNHIWPLCLFGLLGDDAKCGTDLRLTDRITISWCLRVSSSNRACTNVS